MTSKLVLVGLLAMLTGCATTVPVAMKFPAIPDELQVSCGELEKIPADTKLLSVTAEVVIRNYGKYHECKIKTDAWKEWYDTQKKIFEGVK